VLDTIATDPTARLSARVAILDRACGKPAQAIQSTVARVDPASLSDEELVAIIAGDREDAGK